MIHGVTPEMIAAAETEAHEDEGVALSENGQLWAARNTGSKTARVALAGWRWNRPEVVAAAICFCNERGEES